MKCPIANRGAMSGVDVGARGADVGARGAGFEASVTMRSVEPLQSGNLVTNGAFLAPMSDPQVLES